MKITRDKLEALYARYNKRKYVSPDPLEFVYRYDEPREQEIVALIASSLAYGRVQQILKSISRILSSIGNPFEFITSSSKEEIYRTFEDFKHRFTDGKELSELIVGIKNVIERYGSLGKCFSEIMESSDDIIVAQKRFIGMLTDGFANRRNSLLPMVDSKSANKRFNLFLRWMVRSDDVDLGIWNNSKNVSADKLIVPVDTHMHKISLMLGLTKRRQADMKTAIEIADAFREICPEDPVRYDFVLTRFGIRDDMKIDDCRAMLAESKIPVMA